MQNDMRSGRAVRLALSSRPLQASKIAVTGVLSSAALSSSWLRPNVVCRKALAAR
jgi:hypothetical protein